MAATVREQLAELLGIPIAMRMGPVRKKLHRMTWEATGWRPYGLQSEILLNTARNQVVAAGRRAGKSQVGGHKLIPEVFRAFHEQNELKERGLRREFWIVGPEYSDAEKEFRVFWDGVTRLGFKMDHPGSYNNTESGQMRVSMFNERFIVHAKSAKYPSTLVGEGLSGVVFSEAAKLKPSVWIKYIRPTLADFVGWSYFGSTPEGKNWFYDLWMIGQDESRHDWASWRAPAWANPYVYRQGVDEDLLQKLTESRRRGQLELLIPTLKMVTSFAGRGPEGIDPEIWGMFLDMSQEAFNQEIAALFTEFVGRVFKNFDEEIHVNSNGLRADWNTYACVDYGFTNPTVWLLVQVDPHRERVHVVSEYYERGRSPEEAAREIAARGLVPPELRGFYPDPASPGDSRILAEKLRVRALNPGSLSINDRLEWMRRGLKLSPAHLQSDHPEKLPGLTINRTCVNTIREFNDYRYPETFEAASERGRPAPENPQKKDDHTPEALGRLYSGLFGSPWKHGPRQSKAVVGRRSR